MIRVLLIILVGCLSGSSLFAADFFSAERSIPTIEQRWLNSINRSDSWQELTAQSADISLRQPIQWQLQPELTEQSTYVLRLSSKRLTYPVFEGGMTIEQSGHAVTLPPLPDIDVQSDLKNALTFWLSVDMSEFVWVLQATQTELGWSDYELLQLLTLYSANLDSSTEQQAFLASFWRQAGYGIRLWSDQQTRNVLIHLRQQAQVPMLIDDNQVWFSPTVSLPESSVNVSTALTGQGMRMVGLHPRYAGRDIAAIPFKLPEGSRHDVISIRVPVHWENVFRLPVTLKQRFLQPQPNVIYQQLSGILPTNDPIRQTASFIDFVQTNFTDAQTGLSLHQSWIAKQSNAPTRLLLLKGWWHSQVGGTSAIIVNGENIVLALTDQALTEENSTLFHRGKFWQLWSSDLTRLDTFDFDQSQWVFL